MTGKRLLYALTLLAPCLFLAGSVALNQHAIKGGTSWKIPIEGYDPRLPLRGHYFAFSYAWNMTGDPALCAPDARCALCLSEEAGAVTARIAPAGTACPGRVDPAASNIRFHAGTGPDRPFFSSRIFISEKMAETLQRNANAGNRWQLTATRTPDGRLIPRRIDAAKTTPAPD